MVDKNVLQRDTFYRNYIFCYYLSKEAESVLLHLPAFFLNTSICASTQEKDVCSYATSA